MASYSMTLPDVGEGIAEVEISEWMVNIGDTVKEDDLLCVVLTDKAAVEIPSPVDGVVGWIGSEEGSTLAVGSELISFDIALDEVQDSHAEVVKETTAHHGSIGGNEQVALEPVSQTRERPNARASEVAKPVASPSVRQRARDIGVDLRRVSGSGPSQRITHSDLDKYVNGTQTENVLSVGIANTAVREVKVTGLRRKIGEIMQSTMQRIPHYSYVEEIDVTELENLRQRLNEQRGESKPKLTLLPFIIRGLVRALSAYPQMGSRYDDQAQVLLQSEAVHVGIATQTSSGLLVPVIRHAEMLDLWSIAAAVKELSVKARDGKATREELKGSCITISSLGSYGGIVTTPVINAPEVAIIGINKIATRPLWQAGSFVPRQIMNLSSSFDHRIIDGWEATQFIHFLKDLLECPAALFVDKEYVAYSQNGASQ